MAFNGKNVRCEGQEILQSPLGKGIKARLIYNTIYLGDQYMNDNRNEAST